MPNAIRRGLSDNEQLGVVLAELAHYTGTPDDCYFYIWDGWPSFTADDPTPKISIPNRDYFLFHGTLADVADWDATHILEFRIGILAGK
ncbi:hypothetical protein [Rhodococcus opacus]|nr:hypothetical protein [Rhodococcus opacus]